MSATGAPTLDEIDAVLREIAADGMLLGWGEDRPLVPAEARAIMERHRADPSSVTVGRSRETIHAAEVQLRTQSASFRACAAALRSGDPVAVPSGNPPGSGHAETLELLTDAQELRALLHGDPTAVERIDEEHRDLAALFDRAADACFACAIGLQAERHAIHGQDYGRVLLESLGDEEAERRRRRKNAAMAEGHGA